MKLPSTWEPFLRAELEAPYFRELTAFLAGEREKKSIYPPPENVFRALELTPREKVRVVLLGQDPYHDEGQAHGLCFSVLPPTKAPPSLKNMFNELETDLGIGAPDHGDLSAWAKQGVLLLNTVLTVEAHQPNSHKKKGWETFTDAVIRNVNDITTPVVFCLWGAHAQKKGKLVDRSRHVVIEGAHPSPLSAKKFFGSKPFSAINAALMKNGGAPIEWDLRRSS
jgi:uracil-DNA glycosylase